MATQRPNFEIAAADRLEIADAEISELLTEVYVGGGYTSADDAGSLFNPATVKARGILIAARDTRHARLAGFVIVVAPPSRARRLAHDDEAELQLLGVRAAYRRHGVGRMLMDAAIEKAQRLGCTRLVLWTQPSMVAAQRLYEATGFAFTGEIRMNGRKCKAYARTLGG